MGDRPVPSLEDGVNAGGLDDATHGRGVSARGGTLSRLVGDRLHWPAASSPAAQELAAWGNEAEREGDPGKRAALLQRIQRRLLEIGPYAPMFTPAQPYGFRSDLRGVTFNSVWKIDYSAVRRV